MDWLLWQDADKKRSLEDKVSRAAARYREKFGIKPDTCYINAGQMNGVEQVDGVRLRGAGNVSPDYFRIGIEEAA